MLNFFNSFVVPGVDGVVIYQDDQDDHQFWMLKEFPTVARGADGQPMFNLIVFARDFRLSASDDASLNGTETEGGLLSVTLELAVSQEDQDRIRAYIRDDLLRQAPRFQLRPVLRGPQVRIARRTGFTKPIKLSYPVWTKGSSAFHALPTAGETFIKGAEGSKSPSLTGNNISTYAVMLGQEGVRLFNDALEEGWSPGTINYDVSFVARIPSLTVTIKGNTRNVYEELKRHTRVHEVYRQGNVVRSYRYPAVGSLEELQEMVTGLDIQIDAGDFRSDASGASGETVTDSIRSLAFTLIQNYLTNVFFSSGFEPGLVAEKLGTDPLAREDPDREGPPAPANQLWLKEFKQEWSAEIDFTFTSRQNIEITKHPNTQLFAVLPPEEVKQRIIAADLSEPYFSILDVPVRVTANFERDPIAAITVFLDYEQHDDRTGTVKRHSEAFTFDTGDEVFRFRTVMARDAGGVPKDTYRYHSRITYKASSRAETSAPRETRERSLILGYDELNFIEVKALWGAVSQDLVERIALRFRYPDSDAPSATAEVFLTPEETEASWFTYTGGHASRTYEYETTFFLSDGQRVELPLQRTTASRLVINAPFEDKLRVTFVPIGTFPPIASIVVSVRYRDDAAGYEVDEVHTFRGLGETWTWEPALRDRTKRAYEYKVDVTYADGSAHQSDWQTGTEGTLLVGDVAREMLNIEVVPNLLDFQTQWRLVIVRLHYQDPDNGIDRKHTIKITAENAGVSHLWEVPLQDASRRAYSYTMQAFGQNPADRLVVGPVQTEDPLIVLEADPLNV